MTNNPDLLKDIKLQNDYCGVTECRSAGITGKGVVIWDMESYPGKNEHGARTKQRVLDAAPDATVIVTSPNIVASDAKIEYADVISPIDNQKYSVEEFIKKYKIKILTRSVGGAFTNGTASEAFWRNLRDKYNLIIFTSMGNNYDEQKTKDDPIAMLVGACGLIKGKPKRDNYSSTGIDIDFIDFRGWDSGTSFSTPYLAGKAALIAQINPNITHQEACEYFKANSEDLQEPGFDTYTGYGLPIMRNLEMFKEEIRMLEFKDVPKSKWYAEAINYCIEKGYMNGINEEEFRPEEPLTRAQLAQVLFNLDKKVSK